MLNFISLYLRSEWNVITIPELHKNTNLDTHIIVTKSCALASGGFVSIFRHNNNEKYNDFEGIKWAKSVNCSYVIMTMFLLVTAGISRY